MGNIGSYPLQPENDDIWWTNGRNSSVSEASKEDSSSHLQPQHIVEETEPTPNQLDEKNNLNDFKFEMERKHEKRREIMAAKKKQFDDLRQEVKTLKEENERLKSSHSTTQLNQLQRENQDLRLLLSSKSGTVLLEEMDALLKENSNLKGELKNKIEEMASTAGMLEKNRELRISVAEMQKELQELNGVVVEFEREREEYKSHVLALKDIISVSKKMLLIRESQLKELRQKVESIEESLSGNEMKLLSQDLRLEYERQLKSIRNLKVLYEERQRSDHKEKLELRKLLDETKKELESEGSKNKEAEERITELEEVNSKQYDDIKSLESNLGLAKAESRQYQAELTVINQLFSEVLLGFNNSQEIDLDKLTRHLEDHHELLQNIVINEISPEASSVLPKVLLGLVSQVHREENQGFNVELEKTGKLETIIEESESQTSSDQIHSPEEIVEILPKVWRVLIELLSHHKTPTNNIPTEESGDENPCYKTVQTPKGPSLVLSVSQTFIRLKDLILEKKSLEKETGHLKQLNTHLESRLQDQEKRLEMVSSELSKTWHVVGKLQKQHQLLHTQEKVLRYELAQKRKLLTNLKEQLEYSREKRQEAREKNSKTEKQWRQLRVEFASRRNTVTNDECNNSQESGYSDERCSSSDEEPGYETDMSECAQKSKEEGEASGSGSLSHACGVQHLADVRVNLNEEERLQIAVEQGENTIQQQDEAIQARLLPNEEREASSSGILSNACPENQVPHVADARVNLKEERLQITVELGENTIQQQDESIQARLLDKPKPDSSFGPEQETYLKETSITFVSSIIEEAIETIIRTSAQNTNNSDSSNSEQKQIKSRSLEEILAAKEERLKRLEGQAQQLVLKVNSTTQKSVAISNKLDSLHESYGESSNSQPERLVQDSTE